MDLLDSKTILNCDRTESVCAEMAKLHLAGAPDDLLSKIGANFLENLIYPSLVRSSEAVVLVGMYGDKIVGFAAAVLNMKKFIKKTIKEQPFKSIWYGCNYILFRPSLWSFFIQAMNISMPKYNCGTAEIFMITVSSTYRGRGYAKELLCCLGDELEKRKMKDCLARVHSDNYDAIKMYGGCGYKEIGTVDFSGTTWKWLACKLSNSDRWVGVTK